MTTPELTDRDEAILAAREWTAKDPLYLDTETTGLGSEDQIIEIAVIDAAGKVILSTFIKPTIAIPETATAIHGITDEMVSKAPAFDVLWPFLYALLRGRAVITYNASFDFRMIAQSVLAWDRDEVDKAMDEIGCYCAMTLYAQFYGDFSEWHGNYRYQKLEKAVRQCGMAVIQGETHRAFYDAQMARSIMLHVAAQKIEGEDANIDR